MRWKTPFFGHVLAWFFLNLAVLAVAGVLVLRWQWRVGLDSFLANQAAPRLTSMAAAVTGELRVAAARDWPEVLERMQDAFGVRFHLCRPDGKPLRNEVAVWPESVNERLRQLAPPRNPPMGQPGPPETPRRPMVVPDDKAPPPPPLGPDDPQRPAPLDRPNRMMATPQYGPLPPPQVLLWSHEPDGSYWWAMRVVLPPPDRAAGTTGAMNQNVLLVRAANLAAIGVAADVTPWLWMLGGAVVLSALFWWPFVFMVNRRLHAMNAATAALADGDFDVAIRPGSVRELADLADSISALADKLKAYINGQRRFLGDIAHELCSPLARMEMAIGILESRISGAAGGSETLDDLRDDTREMAALVNELLSFSKASLARDAITMENVALREVVEEAARREDITGLTCDVPEDLLVRAHPDLLRRALANVLRNASHHGGPGGIAVGASRNGESVHLTIRDDGPGVPDDTLARLFEPFYRPDGSRARETGGVGLGLAIVKSCVDGCGGAVSLHNRQPHGLEVRIELKAAE